LLVEQNVRISLEIANYAYVLDNGSVVYPCPARELAQDEARVQSLAGASAEDWAMDENDLDLTVIPPARDNREHCVSTLDRKP